MWSIRTLPEFDEWLDSVRDGTTRRRLIVRIRRLGLGHEGDVRSVGDAIWEMREHFGPGWRMYYTRRGGQVVLMLGGGDKSTQRQDIAAAKARALRIL